MIVLASMPSRRSSWCGLRRAGGRDHAFLIVKLKVPDLLATLAIMFLLTGLQLIPTAGRSISVGLILPMARRRQARSIRSFLHRSLKPLRRESLCGHPDDTRGPGTLRAHRTHPHRPGCSTQPGANEVAWHGSPVANTARIKTYAYVLRARWQPSAASSSPPRVGPAMSPSGASLLMDSVAASLDR